MSPKRGGRTVVGEDCTKHFAPEGPVRRHWPSLSRLSCFRRMNPFFLSLQYSGTKFGTLSSCAFRQSRNSQVHTACIQPLHVAGSALTAYVQCFHDEVIAFTQCFWVRVFRELHAHFAHTQKIAKRHDPTCLNVINLGARILEKMVASACLQMTPVHLDLYHLTRLTLRFTEMTHKSGRQLLWVSSDYTPFVTCTSGESET
jgi:hypothetical protein